MKRNLILALAVAVSSTSAFAAGAGWHRDKVVAKLSDQEAIVRIKSADLKAGDPVEFFKMRCIHDTDSGCTKVPLGAATISQKLSPIYYSVKVDGVAKFAEGTFVGRK